MTGGFFALIATPAAVGVSAEAHKDLVRERRSLREMLGQTYLELDALRSILATLDSDHARLHTLSTYQTQVRAKIYVMIRMQQTVSGLIRGASASNNHGIGPGTA